MGWTENLPRAYYAKYERVPVASDWFEVYRLPGGVYAIAEPRHFQEVNSFLIIGAKKALQFDSGMGIGDIRAVVRELYPGEVMLVNSHFHFDHIADNRRYGEIYSCDEPYALSMLRRGFTPDELAFQVKDGQFWGEVPPWLNREAYHIPAIDPIPVGEGHVFDLGDRRLRVLCTPGHSADCIMLLDEENRMLFTGDAFYLGALYAHFDGAFLGRSDFGQYLDTFDRLRGLIPKLDCLVCSHNDPLVSPEYLQKAYEAFRAIAEGRAEPEGGDIGLHGHGQEEAEPLHFRFDGFSAIVNRKDFPGRR